MFRSRSWFGSGLWKPKNPHSLEHLKYLYNVLSKNQTVSDTNRGLLVETLRSIAEILIWGDQNDSSVFDFFLEKNMLSFFLKIMKQKCGSYVCVQLLQTLNILFENIRNETSLYYLLSNNHVNSIIVHKFDFSDEEVMAYYISFLKTLSLKLNSHTIHFFYNEHTNDFPLYTEAIKFFNHPESMVRIAVRTLTLNVYRVEDRSMLKFIRDKTAAPYFSNLVWFIGNHILELDSCVRNDADHQSQNRLADLVAEHLDHLHYLNDILCLEISDLNQVLTEHLLNKLFIPLYVYSLTKRRRHSQIEEFSMQNVAVFQKMFTEPLQNLHRAPRLHRAQFANRWYKDIKPHVSSVVSLFLLSQVFLIITHGPLVHILAWIILNGDMDIFSEGASEKLALYRKAQGSANIKPGFVAPEESLEKSLETNTSNNSQDECDEESNQEVPSEKQELEVSADDLPLRAVPSNIPVVESPESNLNITDEEKEQMLALETTAGADAVTTTPNAPPASPSVQTQSLANKPFLEMIFNTLECSENDYAALFALCLLYALGHNQGVNEELLDSVLFPSEKPDTKHWYNILLVEKLIKIISLSCQPKSRVRLVTLELSIRLLMQLVMKNGQSFLHDCHLAAIEGAKEESTCLLRNFYKSEEIFLDMFEDEYNEMKKRPLNVEWLMMDSNILLPPTGTPMTGIEFGKRLPCGEVERARRAIRVFFLIRELSLTLGSEVESQLPLTNPQACVQVESVLNLNNSDLIACTVVNKDGQKIRRFLVIDVIQLILAEPHVKRLGWGVAKFVGFLQDIEVAGDKDDSRCLHITIHRPLSSGSANRIPLLSAKFIFDDHIRCLAAKQRLTKGRIKARQKKMHMIARLLDIPSSVTSCSSPPTSALLGYRPGGGRIMRDTGHRPLFTNVSKVPGFAAVRRESIPSPRSASPAKRNSDVQGAASNHSGVKSREGSPRLPRPRSEEIPLEDMGSKSKGRASNGCSPQTSAPGGSVESSAKHSLQRSPFPNLYPSVERPVFPGLFPTLVATSIPPPCKHVPCVERPPIPEQETPPNEEAAPAPVAIPPVLRSEETSFTQLPNIAPGQSQEDRRARRKGMVETV